jgi:pyruvate dehydrogenase (quinone)
MRTCRRCPPHVTPKQVRSYFKALMHGEPEARAVGIANAREWWAGLAARKAGGS